MHLASNILYNLGKAYLCHEDSDSCRGYGKRLRPLTDTRPKPMIEVFGVPIIEWQVRWLRKFGMKDVVICAGYMKQQIIDHIGNGARFDCRIDAHSRRRRLEPGSTFEC